MNIPRKRVRQLERLVGAMARAADDLRWLGYISDPQNNPRPDGPDDTPLARLALAIERSRKRRDAESAGNE